MPTLIDTASVARLPDHAHDPGRRFFTAMAGVALAVVLVGFAPSFYLNAFLDAKPLSPLIHVHGFLFTLWPMLFLTQSLLARTGRAASSAGRGRCNAGCIDGGQRLLDRNSPIASQRRIASRVAWRDSHASCGTGGDL